MSTSRLVLLCFVLVDSVCNGGPFCINLGDLCVDLLLDLVGLGLAEHANIGSLHHLDIGIDVNTDNLLIDLD